MSDSIIPQLSLEDSLVRSLACAAITPGLQSLLMFNATPEVLRLTAQITTQMLEVVTGHSITSVTLSTYEQEDDLWGNWGLGGKPETQLLEWKPGLLVNDSKPRLVIIPDLTKLSLAAARACVVLMGADVAHLQRHGKQEYWTPNLFWLAGCQTQQLGMLSPHLLDRFALRLSVLVRNTTNRVAEIMQMLDETSASVETSLNLPKEIQNRLKTALQQHPEITATARERVLAYTNLEAYSHRREIALARLALANAKLEGAAEISVKHVDNAAEMIGLKLYAPEEPEEERENPNPEGDTQKTPEEKHKEKEPQNQNPESQSSSDTKTVPVYKPETPQDTQPSIITIPRNPYQEDTAPVEREAASLQLPTPRFQSKPAARGAIIGVEKAKNFQDIALVSTLLEAAKFQPMRQRKFGVNSQRKLILDGRDFHAYRRTLVAEQMLMLLLDHTCLKKCNWEEELLPYLSWAYVERASICLIQVGVINAQHELRSEKIMAKNILVPRINEGLEAGKGKATPLAHGLDVALQTLRHVLQHGRSTVQQVRLVVITDGRGNVPLADSRAGNINILSPVGTKGIEDALLVAESIRSLNDVKTVLLNPQPQQYPELPLKLAQALGANVIPILPVELGEGEYVG
ncbi:MAG: hypothetical protein ACFKPT_25700 [Gloeotrichia echinulata GP01]